MTIPHDYPTVEKNMLGTFPLMFTNALATLLIAYKTWCVYSLTLIGLSVFRRCFLLMTVMDAHPGSIDGRSANISMKGPVGQGLKVYSYY